MTHKFLSLSSPGVIYQMDPERKLFWEIRKKGSKETIVRQEELQDTTLARFQREGHRYLEVVSDDPQVS